MKSSSCCCPMACRRCRSPATFCCSRSAAGTTTLVALVDDPATRIADLKAGEFGSPDALGQQVVFRADHFEISTPRKVVLTATGDVVINTAGNVVLTPGGTVQLGGTGGRKVVLDGDPVTGGTVHATSTKVLGL